MKYTARDESRVANIARGEAKCYIICHKALSNSNIPSIGLYITFVMVTCFEASSDNCFTFSSAWQAFICIVSSLSRVVTLSCWNAGSLSCWDTSSLSCWDTSLLSSWDSGSLSYRIPVCCLAGIQVRFLCRSSLEELLAESLDSLYRVTLSI